MTIPTAAAVQHDESPGLFNTNKRKAFIAQVERDEPETARSSDPTREDLAVGLRAVGEVWREGR